MDKNKIILLGSALSLVVLISYLYIYGSRFSTGEESSKSAAIQLTSTPFVKGETGLETPSPSPTHTPTRFSPTLTIIPSPTATATPTSIQISFPIGPDDYPEGVNPLTGLPVVNPENLLLSPALISITNFPISARPQAGLSNSSIVYEMYIGEGASRFLAVFYGDYPTRIVNGFGTTGDVFIGPIRSGRLPYESLRQLFRGFLVFASASHWVLPYLDEYTIIYGTDPSDSNTAFIAVSELEQVAYDTQSRLGKPWLGGLKFDPNPPDGGMPGKMIWLPYHYLDQIIWRYDRNYGAYLRFQDMANGKTFTQFTDRLNNEPITYENVVIMFAEYIAYTETYFNIDLMYITKYPALLFRDGQMYEIYWTTGNEEYERTTGRLRPVRFIDYEGNPIPLKPGQTWVEIVTLYSPYNETVASEDYYELKSTKLPGSGNWAIHFIQPENLNQPPGETSQE